MAAVWRMSVNISLIGTRPRSLCSLEPTPRQIKTNWWHSISHSADTPVHLWMVHFSKIYVQIQIEVWIINPLKPVSSYGRQTWAELSGEDTIQPVTFWVVLKLITFLVSQGPQLTFSRKWSHFVSDCRPQLIFYIFRLSSVLVPPPLNG